MRIFLMLCTCILLPQLAYADLDAMIKMRKQQPTLEGFDMCHGGGCALISHVSISPDEWQKVIAAFDPMPSNAEEERAAIGSAIGVMEIIVGDKTDTGTDRGGTFGNSAYPGQLDCNDEATNTTNYMRLMQQNGLLHFHDIISTQIRGFFFHGWPHSTAAIQDQATKENYAVDSWFYDNGMPAVVVPLKQWKSGWKPADFNHGPPDANQKPQTDH